MKTTERIFKDIKESMDSANRIADRKFSEFDIQDLRSISTQLLQAATLVNQLIGQIESENGK